MILNPERDCRNVARSSFDERLPPEKNKGARRRSNEGYERLFRKPSAE
jgi:hypothetical protein